MSTHTRKGQKSQNYLYHDYCRQNKNDITIKGESLKTERKIKRKNNRPIGYILCKVHVWKWLVIKDKYIKIKPGIYVLFVFDLDGECNSLKTKRYSD